MWMKLLSLSCNFSVFKLILPLSMTISWAIAGCAASKASQCQKIREIPQKVTGTIKDYRQTKEPEKVLEAAAVLEQAAAEMEKLKIEDEQLIEYQQGFAQVYRTHAQATRAIVVALEEKDAPKARSNLKKVQQAGEREQKLGAEMNRYCQKTDE